MFIKNCPDFKLSIDTRAAFHCDNILPVRLPHPGNQNMTYVVGENCIKCKYTDCVDVCPVDCFHEGPNFLVIDPEECIDCTLCVPECPANAIFVDDELPDDQSSFLALNEELSREWPVINESKDSPDDADEWDGVVGKLEHLQR